MCVTNIVQKQPSISGMIAMEVNLSVANLVRRVCRAALANTSL